MENSIPQRKTSEDRLLDFVSEQIEKMNKHCAFGDIPGFYELNQALIDYTPIQTALISMDVVAKSELFKAKEALDDWDAQKYVEVKEQLNPPTLAASKWCSSSEINAYIRVQYGAERRKLAERVNLAENKVAVIRRLLDAWDGQKLVLNRLCKNVEIEAMQLGGGFIKVDPNQTEAY